MRNVCGAGGYAARWGCGELSGVRVDGEEVDGVVEVGAVGGGEGGEVDAGGGEDGGGVVGAEEEGVGFDAEDEVLVAEGGGEVGGVGGVEGHGDVVCEFEGDFPRAFEFFFVEMVDFGMGHEDVVVVGVVVEVDVGFVEGDPDGDAVGEAGHDLFGKVEECVGECC